MRRLFASLILSMPLFAAGQTLDAPHAADPMLAYRQLPGFGGAGTGLVPLWRSAGGHQLVLMASRKGAGDAPEALDFRVVDASDVASTALGYDLGPHLQAYAGLSQRSWLSAESDALGCSGPECDASQPFRLLSGELGATYSAGRYRVGVAVGSTKPATSSTPLPRVLPNAAVTASGMPVTSLDNSTSFSAEGRMALGGESGIDLGASVGRIRLLPGNLLGVSTLGQKSLSLGMDSGPLSGKITGHVVQPEMGEAALLGPDHRWTSVDLGVTWRLPWQGELSFGAQNVWSSGPSPAAPVAPANGAEQPGKSSIPYVQYHQDL